MNRSRILVPALALAIAACAREAPPPSAVGATMTTADFARLRYLDGHWRGTEAGGSPFHEAYRFLDDSTIRSYEYGDSTIASLKDSGTIQLRAGVVTSGAPARWTVTRFDSVMTHFQSTTGTNAFTWTTTGPDSWTAVIAWDSAGVPKTRTYQMQRIP